jgi:uncharacterized protein YbbK (DUF523 family)
MTAPVKIGVSACLIGEHVRYDGEDKHDRHVTDLGKYFTLVPVCPEVGCGLTTPREAMRLEGNPAAPRLMTCQTRVDKSEQMLAYCSAKCRELENEGLCGFIFKERSPSCGLTAVPLSDCGMSYAYTVGLFAHEIVSHFPLMPVEEAEHLNNELIRKSFVESVFLYSRTRQI